MLIPILLISGYLIFSQFYLNRINSLDYFEAKDSGQFTELERGILYLPENWSKSKPEGWPVTIILPGFSTKASNYLKNPQWKKQADSLGIVLFFVSRHRAAWYEHRDSEDMRNLDSIIQSFRNTSWVKRNSLHMFGFSAGGSMVTSYLAHNISPFNRKAPMDKISLGSCDFGLLMTKHTEKDPTLSMISDIPVFVFWGEKESRTVGENLYHLFLNGEWDVKYSTHPKGHWLTDEHIKESLMFSIDG